MPLFPPGGFFSLTSRSKVHIIERLTGSSAAGSALGSGPRGREFKSPLSDHERKMHLRVRLFLLLESGTPGLLHLNHRPKAAAPRSGGAAGSFPLSPTAKGKKGQSRSDRNRPVACFGARVRVGGAAAPSERVSSLRPRKKDAPSGASFFVIGQRDSRPLARASAASSTG